MQQTVLFEKLIPGRFEERPESGNSTVSPPTLTKELNIDERTQQTPGGRIWDVNLTSASEAREERQETTICKCGANGHFAMCIHENLKTPVLNVAD